MYSSTSIGIVHKTLAFVPRAIRIFYALPLALLSDLLGEARSLTFSLEFPPQRLEASVDCDGQEDCVSLPHDIVVIILSPDARVLNVNEFLVCQLVADARVLARQECESVRIGAVSAVALS
jgi:hypothetical protein